MVSEWAKEAWRQYWMKSGDDAALDVLKSFTMEEQTGIPHCVCHLKPLNERGECSVRH